MLIFLRHSAALPWSYWKPELLLCVVVCCVKGGQEINKWIIVTNFVPLKGFVLKYLEKLLFPESETAMIRFDFLLFTLFMVWKSLTIINVIIIIIITIITSSSDILLKVKTSSTQEKNCMAQTELNEKMLQKAGFKVLKLQTGSHWLAAWGGLCITHPKGPLPCRF